VNDRRTGGDRPRALRESVAVRNAIDRILGERPAQEVGEVVGERVGNRYPVQRIFVQDLVDESSDRVRRERLAVEDHLVEDDPQREQIAPPVERRAFDLLRRHVGGAADHHAGAGQLHLLADRLGDAEVGDLHLARLGEHQVAGLDVAVNDSRFVRGAERLGGLRDHLERLLHVGKLRLGETLAERLALDELHHQVELIPFGADVVDRDHVGVLEAGGDARLALEARQDLFAIVAGGHRRDDRLDGDRAVELRIDGAIDGAHRSTAKLADDTVPTDRRGDLGLHSMDSIRGGRQLPLATRRPGMRSSDCSIPVTPFRKRTGRAASLSA